MSHPQVLDSSVTQRKAARSNRPRALSQCATDVAGDGSLSSPRGSVATAGPKTTRAAGRPFGLLLRSAGRPVVLALAAAVSAAALLPSPARAAFGVQSFSATTQNADTSLFTQAAGHPFTGITAFTLNSAGGLPDPFPAGILKNIHVEVPPGVVPDPESLPKCASLTPNLANCGVATQIGTTTIDALVNVAPPVTSPVTVPVFNMEAPDGLVSEFAFSLAPFASRVNIEGTVRDTGDYGVVFDIRNLSGTPPVMGATLRFWGVPAEHTAGGSPAPFVTTPTFCGPPYTTRLTVESQTGATATASDTTPTGATGCDAVPFTPTVTVTPGTTRRDTPTGGSVSLHVPALRSPTGLESSHVKDTVITLPEGMTLNPSAANGLQACTDAQLAKGTHDPVACPDASAIGTVEIVSANLAAPLTGSLWVGQPLDQDPYRLFLRATNASGLDVRLKGSVAADAVTGRLTATFADTPQTPFTDFTLTFGGGARATLATPLTCGAAVTSSSIVPYRGGAPATPTAAFTVDADGAGGACGATPFTPAFAASTSVTQAGADTAFGLGVTRRDGEQTLSRVQVGMPPGLVGRIPAVPLCTESGAATGTCGEASRIGTSTVAAGAGAEPFVLSGPVYLTGPYDGAPYGLVFVIRALAGPYDLGTVVVRARIRVDSTDAHLTVDSDALPTILKGIPLRLRRLDVTVDRPGFLLNPTACGQHTVRSAIRSVDGSAATPAGQIGVAGCEQLAFTPTITATAAGRPTRKRGGSLLVTLTQPPGQANLRKVSVQLPREFSARGDTVALACLEAVYVADPNACGPVSRVGTAEATTPVLPGSLNGHAWLVGHNARLPTLEVRLEGSGVQLGLSSLIKFGKGYSSTFDRLPDVPVRRFTIDLPQGPHSLIGVAGSLCRKPRLSMPTTYTGQDGRTRTQIVRLKVANCGVTVTSARILRGGRALLAIKAPTGGRLTVTGKGLRRATRTLRRAGTAHLTVPLSVLGAQRLHTARGRRRALRLTATVRLVPSAANRSATPSTARRVLVLR